MERTKLERSSARALYVLQTDFVNPEILSKLPINAHHVGRLYAIEAEHFRRDQNLNNSNAFVREKMLSTPKVTEEFIDLMRS